MVEAEDGRLAIVSACTDITEVMAVQQQLAERNKLLISQNEELAFLNEDMPGGYHRCLDAPGCDFLYMSDRFLDMFGYTREEIKELFDDKYMLMVHPDDRDSVAKGVTALREGTAGSDPLEYRMRAKDGWRWVIDQSRFLEYDDTSFLQGVVVDVTETVELRDMMSMLIEHTSSDIVLLSWSDKEDVRVNVVACGASKKYGSRPSSTRISFAASCTFRAETGAGAWSTRSSTRSIEARAWRLWIDRAFPGTRTSGCTSRHAAWASSPLNV